MELKDIVLKRRSIRTYNKKEVADEDIQTLLESAMAAPSACNKRPWEFYVIRNKEIQESLRKVSRYTNYESPLIIVVAADDKRSLGHRINDFWIQDCAAAIENMLLTATSLGLSTCWCGLFPMVTPVKRTRKVLNLPENIIPMALIHIGYSDEVAEPRTQYNQKRVHIIE